MNCWAPIFDFNTYEETGRFSLGTLEQGSRAESFSGRTLKQGPHRVEAEICDSYALLERRLLGWAQTARMVVPDSFAMRSITAPKCFVRNVTSSFLKSVFRKTG